MGAEQSTPVPTEQQAGDAPGDATATAAAAAHGPRALVIVGPSGVGKGTLIKRLLSGPDGATFVRSVSHTTRPPKAGESDGSPYHFTSREAFERDAAAGAFWEQAELPGGHLFGTPRAAVQAALDSGKVPLLVVDVQGARGLRAAALPALFVFVAPPSLEELERRLGSKQQQPDAAAMAARLAAARAQISALNEAGLFDYLLLNNDLEGCVGELQGIAARAAQGLPAEPGKVPDEVRFEEEGSDGAAALASNAAAAAAAGIAAAELPLVGDGRISTTPRAPPSPLSPALQLGAGGGSPQHSAAAAAGASPRLHEQQQQPATTQQQQHQEQQLPLQPQQQQQQVGPSGAAAAGHVAQGLEAWRGKVALVTGASSGIGWAVCEALGRAGLRVVAVARRRERLQELQQLVLSPGVGMAPTDFLPVVCDVTKEAEVAALPKIIVKHWPDAGVDVLVNNAGLSRNDASLFDGNTASWVEMVSTNILGNAMASRMALQDMRRRGSWGHIINMVGLSGHRIPDAPAGGTFFAATKHAVRAITEGLRQEARAAQVPLRVSGISPGIVETEFFTVRAFGDTSWKDKMALAPLQPADVANAVLWALAMPAHMEVNDIVIRPTQQMI